MVEGVDGTIPQPDGKLSQSDDKTSRSESEKRVQQRFKPLQKVARTLLEQKNPSANLQQEASGPVSSDVVIAPRKFKKISRTMLDLNMELAGEELLLHTNFDSSEPQHPHPSSPKQIQAGSGRFVARTMLDHSMLFQAVSKSNVKMEQKAAEEALERAKNPVERIEPIVADRKVSKCQWSWPDPFYGKERYRACAICQAGVYDFEGLEREQAEAIVFKRENSKKPKFYERGDGKFMIRDCPKAVAHRMQLLTLSVVAIGLAASLILAMVLMPPAPDLGGAVAPVGTENIDVVDKSPTSAPGAALHTESTTTSPIEPGMSHYENGKITRTAVGATTQQPVTTTTPSVPVPDANDAMWQDGSK
ncbi:hypothetical protein BH10CYA1_BH10CYA1_61070 [soil metagenome]